MSQDKEKDSYIRIRIDSKTKEDFLSLCKSKSINSSELIRKMIYNWLKDNR